MFMILVIYCSVGNSLHLTHCGILQINCVGQFKVESLQYPFQSTEYFLHRINADNFMKVKNEKYHKTPKKKKKKSTVK
jgi:hypothetical protein